MRTGIRKKPILEASAKFTCDPFDSNLCCALAAARRVPVGSRTCYSVTDPASVVPPDRHQTIDISRGLGSVAGYTILDECNDISAKCVPPEFI